MAPTVGRFARPERQWGSRCGTLGKTGDHWDGNKAVDMAQNCPLWILMSTSGATHS